MRADGDQNGIKTLATKIGDSEVASRRFD